MSMSSIRSAGERPVLRSADSLPASEGSAEESIYVRNGEVEAAGEGGARRGWCGAFRRMAMRGDDRLILPDASAWPEWDESGWSWE
jgi:hypothetical protein